jgi:Ser/Thr protein kinase RdoA (MazF antagonist)
MSSNSFQERIGYKGDLKSFFESVVGVYELGELLTFSPIMQGYEDFNIKVETSNGKYLFKLMSSSRSDEEIKQYVDIMQMAVDGGVSHPKIYASSHGNLYTANLDGIEISLVVMEFIEGQDFYKLGIKPTDAEMKFIVSQATKINKIDFRPKYVYDSWAIPSFPKEYEAIKSKLDKDDLEYIAPLAHNFPGLEIDKLPHCFVHGDIIATNVIKDNNGKLYIIDFAVSNYYPRIQELAILLCGLLYINNKDKYLANYNLALDTYQQVIKLEQREIDILPTYIKLAHAMHIIGATREKLKGSELPENNFWLNSGQDGIRISNNIWV